MITSNSRSKRIDQKNCSHFNFQHFLFQGMRLSFSRFWNNKLSFYTAQKMKFFIKDFLSKCDQIRSFFRIRSHLLKKSLMESFIFYAVLSVTSETQKYFIHSNRHQILQPFQGCGGAYGLHPKLRARRACAPRLPRFILLGSFSGTLVMVSILDIVYDCHLQLVLQS